MLNELNAGLHWAATFWSLALAPVKQGADYMHTHTHQQDQQQQQHVESVLRFLPPPPARPNHFPRSLPSFSYCFFRELCALLRQLLLKFKRTSSSRPQM